MILLLIGGTWILYKKPGEAKEKITINSIKPGIPSGKKSTLTIYKP